MVALWGFREQLDLGRMGGRMGARVAGGPHQPAARENGLFGSDFGFGRGRHGIALRHAHQRDALDGFEHLAA